MNLQSYSHSIPESLGQALARFEHHFEYPLGHGVRFRISHGQNYLTFFSSMGSATLVIAEMDGEILGTLVRVERKILGIHTPDPSRTVHYLADLKVHPRARHGRVLASLIGEARRQIEASSFQSCFCIVMEGTGRLPTDYTGRLGVPDFIPLARIMILRITSGNDTLLPHVMCPSIPQYPPLPHSHTPPAWLVTGGNKTTRSCMPPLQLTSDSWLEDTRNGKRLWLTHGEELLTAHFTSFRFSNAAEAAPRVQEAFDLARTKGFEGLFLSVPINHYPELKTFLSHLKILEAPATVYGYQLPVNQDWWVDTSEI